MHEEHEWENALVAHYRLYLLGKGNRIHGGVDLDCPDDNVAVSIANERAGERGIEVWQGTRRVLRVSPEESHRSREAPQAN